jgi:hypothetical protein
MMLVRLAVVLMLGIAVFAPGLARARCADEVSRLMSKDTERLLTHYNRVSRRIEKEGATPSLRAEECRVAKQLESEYDSQLAALKQLRCRREENEVTMIADFVRTREDDLAMLRRVTTQPDCR